MFNLFNRSEWLPVNEFEKINEGLWDIFILLLFIFSLLHHFFQIQILENLLEIRLSQFSEIGVFLLLLRQILLGNFLVFIEMFLQVSVPVLVYLYRTGDVHHSFCIFPDFLIHFRVPPNNVGTILLDHLLLLLDPRLQLLLKTLLGFDVVPLIVVDRRPQLFDIGIVLGPEHFITFELLVNLSDDGAYALIHNSGHVVPLGFVHL